MIYHVVERDLMTVPQGYSLAHCISADYALGAGVAKQIDKAYGMRNILRSQVPQDTTWPCCIMVQNVFNLVTKEKYWHKPTLNSLRESLLAMKKIVIEGDIKKIAMPKIGCGLDRLNWIDVSRMIQEIFSDVDVEIMVCVLPGEA